MRTITVVAVIFAIAALAAIMAIVVLRSRHERHERFSLIHDPPIKCAYSKAYYYELDNLAFENALRTVFGTAGATEPTGTAGEKGSITTPLSKKEIESIRLFLLGKMNARLEKEFALPGDIVTPFQIVDEAVVEVRSLGGLGLERQVVFDVITYRLSKYHGKHIRFEISIIGAQYIVRSVQVIGIIPEEEIAMFPISASDSKASTLSPY